MGKKINKFFSILKHHDLKTRWFGYVGGIAPRILEFGFKLEINGQSHAANALDSRREISWPTDKRLDEHQWQSGHNDAAKDACLFGNPSP